MIAMLPTPVSALLLALALPRLILEEIAFWISFLVNNTPNPYVPKKWTPFVIGSILLMIAFLVSAFIMAAGARFFGLDIFRVRSTISIGFFLFAFVAILLYYNMAKRVPAAAQIG